MGPRSSIGVPSAETDSMRETRGPALLVARRGSTTERPRLMENQMRPNRSTTTDRWRLAASVLESPSERPYWTTSVSARTPPTS